MDGRKITLWIAAVTCLLAAMPAKAGLILLNSGAGLSYSNLISSGQTGGVGASGTTVAITPHPLWQSNNPNGSSAVWISYANTGYGGSHFQPFAGSTPVVSIFETFTNSGPNWLTLDIWSDDSAGVFVDGIQVFAPVTTQGSGGCSGQAIGCLPNQEGVLSNYLLGSGTHTIRFDLYQTGPGGDASSNPMGLLFTGYDTNAPEPGAFLLVGAGLLTVGALRRWSRSRP